MTLKRLTGKGPGCHHALLTAKLAKDDIEKIQRRILDMMCTQQCQPLCSLTCSNMVVHECLPNQSGELRCLVKYCSQTGALTQGIPTCHT